MIHRILSYLYELPIVIYIVFALAAISVWLLLSIIIKNEKTWKRINAIVLILTCVVIFFIVIIFRNTEKSNYSFIPFHKFELAKTYTDLYSEMALNVLLFIPIGLTLPFVITDKSNHPVVISIVIALLFAIFLESLQYVLMRGYAEIDDVIFNILGAFLGTLSFDIFIIFKGKHIYKKISD